MKKLHLFLVFVLLISASNIWSVTNAKSNEVADFLPSKNAMCSYNLLSKIKNQRETTYNALNLTTDQIKYKNEIDLIRYEKLTPLVVDLCKQHYVLVQLMVKEVSKSEICNQEKIIKNIQNDIKKISDNYDNEFTKTLDHNQKSKFAMIKSLQRNGYKKVAKIKQNGKKTSTLRTFGEKISQPDYQQSIEKHFLSK